MGLISRDGQNIKVILKKTDFWDHFRDLQYQYHQINIKDQKSDLEDYHSDLQDYLNDLEFDVFEDHLGISAHK